uniref:C2 NT-type domain-containing protein n=1 Tax=Rhodosorus marinus TaxID=101924 RepID=A0A7S3EJX4_9RHOD
MSSFQKKIFKMLLKGTGSNSILGKTNFDAAAYADPEEVTMQRRLKFKLSNQASVIMTITTTRLSMDQGQTGSIDGSVGDSGSFVPSDVGSDELAVDFDLDDVPVGATTFGDPRGGGNSLSSRLDVLTKRKVDLEKENARLKKEVASAGKQTRTITKLRPLESS